MSRDNIAEFLKGEKQPFSQNLYSKQVAFYTNDMNRSDSKSRSIFEMILASSAFAVMATFVKSASYGLHSFEVVFVRSLFGSIAMFFLIRKNRSSLIGTNPKILILRGVFGFLALSMNFYAISQLNLGTAVILNYTAPIFAAIFARFILGEKTNWIIVLAILTSFFGLYLLATSQFETKLVPILIGILSGIFAALAYVMIRFGGENESGHTIIFYFTAISTLGSLPLMLSVFEWPDAHQWVSLLGVTVGAFFGQVWLTKSIQGAPVSLVLPFTYLTPVFCAITGSILWHEELSAQTVIGGLMIIASGIAVYLFRKKTLFVPIEE